MNKENVTYILFSFQKKKGVLSFATTWMSPEDIMFISEVRQAQREDSILLTDT